MSVVTTGITCDCGKWHATAGIGPASACTCERRLWPMVWDLKHDGFTGNGRPTVEEQQ